MTVPSAALIRRVLDRFGRAAIDVADADMAPTLAPGDRVELTVRPFAEVTVGEVVAVETVGRVVVRRVVHRDDRKLFTAGDGRPRVDPPAHRRDYLGVAEGAPPFVHPSLAALAPPPAGTAAPRVRLWVFEHGVAAPEDVPVAPGLSLTRLPRAGIGVDRPLIGWLREQVRGADLRIAVCQSAREPAAALPAVDLRRYGTVEVVAGVGVTAMAPPLADGTVLLPENLVDIFVRTAPLGSWPPTSGAVASLIPFLLSCVDDGRGGDAT